MTRWWFQIWGTKFDEHIFQMGWFNHQPGDVSGGHLANVGSHRNQPAQGASRLESAGGLWSGATQVAPRSVAQSGATDLSGGRNLPGGFPSKQ